jgi:hypothetical protein
MVVLRIVRRFFSKADGQTMMFALAASSSRVMNRTPLAEPGRRDLLLGLLLGFFDWLFRERLRLLLRGTGRQIGRFG